eukprot:5734649-Prymnesium_polylepis.1
MLVEDGEIVERHAVHAPRISRCAGAVVLRCQRVVVGSSRAGAAQVDAALALNIRLRVIVCSPRLHAPVHRLCAFLRHRSRRVVVECSGLHTAQVRTAPVVAIGKGAVICGSRISASGVEHRAGAIVVRSDRVEVRGEAIKAAPYLTRTIFHCGKRTIV